MTAAERQKRARDRRKAEGKVSVRVWVPAPLEQAVRAAIAQAMGEQYNAEESK